MDLRKFRHQVSVLKKAGLLPARASSGFKLDARSVSPDWKINGKSLGSIVKKYDDITSGKATALPVTESELKRFRKAGFETTQGKVIVPHSATEKARIVAGKVTIKNKTGIERVQIPVEYHNLNQYLSDLKSQAKHINASKGKNEYFGIRFFGGQRANFYSDIQSLISDLSRYEDIQKRNGRTKQKELYQNLEILRITPAAALRIEAEVDTRTRAMSKKYNREHQKKFRQRLKRKPASLKRYQQKIAERMRDYRANMSEAQKKAYKAKAKKRAKKSRKKNASPKKHKRNRS